MVILVPGMIKPSGSVIFVINEAVEVTDTAKVLRSGKSLHRWEFVVCLNTINNFRLKIRKIGYFQAA